MNNKIKKLDGKTAIVTGSSNGIGRGIALLFGREGANVIVNYSKSEGKAFEVVSEIERSGSRAIAVKAEVWKDRKHIIHIGAAGGPYNSALLRGFERGHERAHKITGQTARPFRDKCECRCPPCRHHSDDGLLG